MTQVRIKQQLILGNWKMNGSRHTNKLLLQAFSTYLGSAKLGICVPSIYISQGAELLANSMVDLGAQDCSIHDTGAYTGEISAAMLADFGVRWCLVGHSERRLYHNESNEQVIAKANRLSKHGICPVICIGENLEQRQSNATHSVISDQMDSILTGSTPDTRRLMVIAYEPVWAIGTGKTATPEQAQEIHALIRRLCTQFDAALSDLYILYGGSMNPNNAEKLLQQRDIDGGLIGGSSLHASDFLAIANQAA